MTAATTSAPPLEPQIPGARPSPAALSPQGRGRSDEGVFFLPGGYVGEDGTAHYEVELAAVTGEEECYFANLDAGAPRAASVTGLLARCVKRVGSLDRAGATLVRDLLVGDRDYLILKLREMTFGKKVSCVLHCADPGCGQPMDLSFDSAALDFAGAPVTQRFFTARVPASGTGGAGVESIRIDFRLPTGGDQEALAALFAADPAAAQAELLARCLRRVGDCDAVDRSEVARLPEAVRGEIEGRMSRLAPRAEIELEALCPECRKPFETVFDVTAFFLDELRGNLRNLEREVHFLAWHYHWSERDILSMTRKKRRRYVALLQEEVDRLSHVW